MRTLVAIVVVLSSWALAAGAGYAATDGPARDPLTLARERLDQARSEATEISGQLSAAQSDQARLQAQITDAEARIPELRAHADELRAEVKRRAALLYVSSGSGNRLESLVAAENAEDGIRAAHLTDTIGRHDLDLAAELRDTAAQLVKQEADLKSRRADLDARLASLAPLNDLLQKRLFVASSAYTKVQALTSGTAHSGLDVDSGATVCPVAGVSVFTDDFGEPRAGGFHPGIDMGALTDTPVVAVVAGFMRHDVGGDGGNGAWLVGNDQVSYYYAHFSHYEGQDRIVNAGDVIGYVGQTGNATGPHLHFEIHPGGGPPADPFATLLALCTGIPPQVPGKVAAGSGPDGATG